MSLVAFLPVSRSFASSLTWDNSGANPTAPTDGTSSLWDTTATVWSDGSTDAAWVNANNDIAVFGSNNGTAGTVNLGSAITANGITFNAATSGNYTIAPGSGPYALTLAGTTPTITANVDATISSVITGSAGFTKKGSGVLTLSGTNSYTGGMQIDEGTVSYSAGANLPASQSITLNGGTLQFAGGSTAYNPINRPLILTTAGGTLDASGATGNYVAFSGGISYSGSGDRTLTLTGTNSSGNTMSTGLVNGTGGTTSLVKNGSGTWVARGATRTYTGDTVINQGTLRTYGDAANELSTTNTFRIAPTGTLSLNSNQTISNLQDGTGGGGTITQAFVTGTVTATLESGAFSGIIKDSNATRLISLAKTTSGTLTLSGTSTYTGATTVTLGTLVASSNKALGNTASLNVNGGALDIRGTGTAGTLTLGSAANFSLSSGSMMLQLGTSFDQLVSSGAGSFSITGGTFALDVTGAGFDYGTTYAVLAGFGGSNSVSGLSFTGYDNTNYLANLGTDGVLSFGAIPEPSTWALLAFSLTTVMVLRRRKA